MDQSSLWIPITIGAAIFQAIRSISQKTLTRQMSAMGVTLVRFLFGLPFALAFLVVVSRLEGRGLPALNANFLAWAFVAAASQVVAQFLLVRLFTLRNFAVGTTYSRTEAVQVAVIGALLFGQTLSLMGWLSIGLSVIGVVMITVSRIGPTADATGGWQFDRSAWLGLGSGLGFAMAVLAIREASMAFGQPGFLYPAAVGLVTVIVIEIVVVGAYLMATDAGQFGIMLRQWRMSLLVGFTGVVASAGWFMALTLQKGAYVKALAQVEFVITLLASVLLFKERARFGELIGMVVVVASIVVLLTLAR